MSKYQEDELYDIRVELMSNPRLEKIFHKKLRKVESKEEYKYTTFFEKYSISYRKAKKKLAKKMKKESELLLVKES
jgi:TnpA family transposase